MLSEQGRHRRPIFIRSHFQMLYSGYMAPNEIISPFSSKHFVSTILNKLGRVRLALVIVSPDLHRAFSSRFQEFFSFYFSWMYFLLLLETRNYFSNKKDFSKQPGGLQWRKTIRKRWSGLRWWKTTARNQDLKNWWSDRFSSR